MNLIGIPWYSLHKNPFTEDHYARLYQIRSQCFSYSNKYQFKPSPSSKIKYYDISKSPVPHRNQMEIESGKIILLSKSKNLLTEKYDDIDNTLLGHLINIFKESLNDKQIESLDKFVEGQKESKFVLDLVSTNEIMEFTEKHVTVNITFPVSLLNDE